jgi:predicted nucleotide-binding protein
MLKLFISYSHKDEAYRKELLALIKGLRLSDLTVWDDRQFSAGDEFAKVILEQIRSADLILLLISHDFMASDYCYEIEMPIALERHEQGSATVLPVIL